MNNERYTEHITLSEMKSDLGKNSFGYVFSQGDVSNVDKLDRLLKQAGGKPKHQDLEDSASMSVGKAKPEYIITFNQDSQTIIVVECKKSLSKHSTEQRNKPSSYAVDGVLYYAKFLKQEYNVIAIAVSGTKKEELRVSTFHWVRGQDQPNEIKRVRDIILEPVNYLELLKGDNLKKSYSLDEIRDTAISMHQYLREIGMAERNKPIFIAGLLIALEDKDFLNSYTKLPSYHSVMQNIQNSIENVLRDSDIKSSRSDYIRQVFEVLRENSKFAGIPLGHNKSVTWYIEQLELRIKPMMNHADSTVDALGVFYHEFVKYSGGDGKGLGIVLTPQHLTEFMCEVADVNKKSKVVDICCGSASFLITAMAKMFRDANPDEIKSIRTQQLYGVEFNDDLYSLAVSNMIIRKDGKSNIYYGDCFNEDIIRELKAKNINCGLINPPFAQSKAELEFMELLLETLTTGGIGVCVVPMSCALGTKSKNIRERLFSKHKLRAVFSMPDDIFYPNGVVTCVMIWEAHNPHNSNQETFFGYYKDDGLVKRKQLGRIDYYNKWEAIKEEWLSLYRNRDIKPGYSVRRCVSHEDEWCAEAYMETDYSTLTEDDFVNSVKHYVAYKILNSEHNILAGPQTKQTAVKSKMSLNKKKWQKFSYGQIFNIHGTKTTSIEELSDFGKGRFPYVTTQAVNNGVEGFFDHKTEAGNVLCIDSAVMGFCSYQESDFTASDHVEKLELRSYSLNKHVAMFLATIINKEQYRYSYGRKRSQTRLRGEYIKLPVDSQGEPDWQFMENYIKSLLYSNNL